MATRKSKPPALSKYGLPKNFITSAYGRGMPEKAKAWSDRRNDLEAALLDIEDAYEHEVLTRQQYLAERTQLNFQIRRVRQEYDKALRGK